MTRALSGIERPVEHHAELTVAAAAVSTNACDVCDRHSLVMTHVEDAADDSQLASVIA